MLSQRGGFYPNTRQETALTFKLQVPSNGDVCIWIEQIYNVNNRVKRSGGEVRQV